jgi:hypothetical protein
MCIDLLKHLKIITISLFAKQGFYFLDRFHGTAPVHRMLRGSCEFYRRLTSATFGMKGNTYLCSQITGGVENALSLHVHIPRTGGKSSDLPFEANLEECLQFPYEYLLLVLPLGGLQL